MEKRARLDGGSMRVEQFHPITTTIGLVKAEPKAALENWLDWQRSVLSQYGMGMEAAPTEGGLEEIIKSLLPLTAPVASRFAFIPTASPWSAYFDNSRLGTNAATTMPVLAERLGCETIRVVMVPHPPSSKTPATHQYNNEAGEPFALVFMHGDGCGPSRLLLHNQIAGQLTDEYDIAVPEMSLGIAIRSSATEKERQSISELIQKCFIEGTRPVSNKLYSSAQFQTFIAESAT